MSSIGESQSVSVVSLMIHTPRHCSLATEVCIKMKEEEKDRNRDRNKEAKGEKNGDIDRFRKESGKGRESKFLNTWGKS